MVFISCSRSLRHRRTAFRAQAADIRAEQTLRNARSIVERRVHTATRMSRARTFGGGPSTCSYATELGFHRLLVRVVWRRRSTSAGTETEQGLRSGAVGHWPGTAPTAPPDLPPKPSLTSNDTAGTHLSACSCASWPSPQRSGTTTRSGRRSTVHSPPMTTDLRIGHLVRHQGRDVWLSRSRH